MPGNQSESLGKGVVEVGFREGSHALRGYLALAVAPTCLKRKAGLGRADW